MTYAVSVALGEALDGISDVIGEDLKLFLYDQLSKVADSPCTDPHEVFAGVTGVFLGCTNRTAPGSRQRVAEELGRHGRAIISAIVADQTVRDRVIELARPFKIVAD